MKPAQNHELVLSSIHKTIDKTSILKGIDITVSRGECLCILGPSGCGKTTLLRLVAGLETLDKGDILFRDRSISKVPAHKRNFTMMFQDYALFPHRTVFSNISFGLEMKKKDKKEIVRRVEQMLETIGLEGFGNRRIDSLSGGESQRVALARALAPEPDLLLLDEPLGSLDRILKERLLEDMTSILKRIGTTTIFVTHDHDEAFHAADRISVMNQGMIEQTDRPETLYHQPASEKVARFLGFSNLVPVRKLRMNTVESVLGIFHLEAKAEAEKLSARKNSTLLILPNYARVTSMKKAKDSPNTITGKLIRVVFSSGRYHIKIDVCSGIILYFDLSPDAYSLIRGNTVHLEIDPRGLCLV